MKISFKFSGASAGLNNLVFKICSRVFLVCTIIIGLSKVWQALELIMYGETMLRTVDSVIVIMVSIVIAELLIRYRKWKLSYYKVTGCVQEK